MVVEARAQTAGLEKTCIDCSQSFPATTEHFHRRRSGLNSYCKACAAARSTRHYQANHEKALAVRAAYRATHQPEITEHIREYYKAHPELKKARDRRWLENNADRVKLAHHTNYEAHKNEYLARARRWETLNPDKIKRHVLAKNHRRRGVPLTKEALEYTDVLKGDPCCYCGSTNSSVQMDHIIPVSAGGTGDWWNLTAACTSCNRTKRNMSLLTFLLKRMHK